jgi:hypothetical protein
MAVNHVDRAVPPPVNSGNIHQYEYANTLLPGQPTSSLQQLSPTTATAAVDNNEQQQQVLHRRTNALDTNGHLRVNEDLQSQTPASLSVTPMGNQLNTCTSNVVMGIHTV